MRCPTCRNQMRSPAELVDGLPGIRYHLCLNCGTTRALTVRARKVSLLEARCPDCGERGERKGHMGCQYPQD